MSSERANADPPVLEMIDLGVASVHAPELVLIDQIRWTVRRGEYWIVGGAPASGKSDLLSTAAGLMRPHHGSLYLFEGEINRMHEEERLAIQLRVGVVFGYGGRLFNHLTIEENLSLPLCYHHNCAPDASEERVQFVLKAMDLSQVAKNNPLALHRSLRQRVALARALVLKPELLVLDNPLVGVDPREARWWLDFLDGLLQGHPVLEQQRLTVIIGTDDLTPWGKRGQNFAIISERRLVPAGNRADLVEKQDPAWRDLLPVDWLRE